MLENPLNSSRIHAKYKVKNSVHSKSIAMERIFAFVNRNKTDQKLEFIWWISSIYFCHFEMKDHSWLHYYAWFCLFTNKFLTRRCDQALYFYINLIYDQISVLHTFFLWNLWIFFSSAYKYVSQSTLKTDRKSSTFGHRILENMENSIRRVINAGSNDGLPVSNPIAVFSRLASIRFEN